MYQRRTLAPTCRVEPLSLHKATPLYSTNHPAWPSLLNACFSTSSMPQSQDVMPYEASVTLFDIVPTCM